MRINRKNGDAKSVEELLEDALETAENDETRYYIREALQKLKIH